MFTSRTTQEVAVSHLPCHQLRACAHSSVAQVPVNYCSKHPKADTAYFIEACNNERGAGVVFPYFIVTW